MLNENKVGVHFYMQTAVLEKALNRPLCPPCSLLQDLFARKLPIRKSH